MTTLAQLRALTPQQRNAVLASFLGWTLDAFDFFLLVFVIKDIAAEFGTDVKSVTFAILLTLAMRPLGAFVFGLLADRYGRRPTLMVDIILFRCSSSLPRSRRRSPCSSCCARFTASPWVASGASAPLW